jgi:hypothetical protein
VTTLEFKNLTLGGIRFLVEEYEKSKHDHARHPPQPMWVRISGLPYRFFKKIEFKRITDELSGSILMEVDLRSSNHLDFSYLRLKLGVADTYIIPPFRKIKFIDFDGTISFHTLFFKIDHEANMLMVEPLNRDQTQGIKIKSY